MAADDGLAQLVSTVADEAGTTGERAFVHLLLDSALKEDIAPYSPADLLTLAAGRYAFLRERRPGRAKVAVTNPDGDFSGVTFIDIANDDMPFLVDSTLGLLNEGGLDIKLFLHPILAVKRDASGLLKDIADGSTVGSGIIRESLIHVHVARLADAAGLARLEAELVSLLADVRIAVLDWQSMRQRMRDVIAQYQSNPPPIPIDELTESIAFLQWLADNHFTFLGMRDYVFEGGAQSGDLKPVPGTGLGILRSPEIEVLRRGGKLVSVTPEIRAFLMQPDALIITKSDVRATVHRRTAMDYIGVKLFDASGDLVGELRVVGLFASSAYTQSPNDIPLLRQKIRQIIHASGLSPASHSGKALASVLESFPRDELFQINAETLENIAKGILRLEERPRTRLFVRRDRFDRFVSAFVFIPRDRFDSDVRARVGEILAKAFEGKVASFEPSFGEGMLVRVHYIIQRADTREVNPDLDLLESEVATAVQTWKDRLTAALRQSGSDASRIARWRDAFPAGYRAAGDLSLALKDIAELEELKDSDTIAVEFVRKERDAGETAHMRFYRRGPRVPLSGRLPILKNMGFKAIAEVTHELTPNGAPGATQAVIHDIVLETNRKQPFDIAARGELLQATFMAIWTGEAENDVLNSLTLLEGLTWREIALLRALGRYLRQAVTVYSVEYLAQTLAKHSRIAAKFVSLFRAFFDPRSADQTAAAAIAKEIEASLNDVENLDEDRILRHHLNLISAIFRTNYFQTTPEGMNRPAISFKFDSKSIDGLPDPRPFAEIFVYSPDVECVHLRQGRIARGGIRWSDRPEDFRTEILGLVKAQNVKNALIVPVGAKGGFVPKKIPQGGSREAIQAEGIRTYKLFISSLLDLTDNAQGNAISHPPDTVRRDGDDPYLVVAADKGTASFSDIANELSTSRGFWLGDAFASGGSAGYDHKKMAITARGGWEAVKRHFRETDIDIQTTPFTVIGVGDMSGDVFGNGMLLSREIRLLAAFDHRDIFIDPDPDIAISFAERQRLFELPRSSWQDYDKSLISPGGGAFSRKLKSIPLSEPIRRLTGLHTPHATPFELISALLKAQADLIWFGGIGTYVKASGETNSDCGDRANDALRVDARDLRAKVIGEGANLALTQRARIEFALKGGRINTDAVDNSAGVNSSDMEVNIKIALGSAEAAGKIDRPQRNEILVSMTGEVAKLVLRNNYLQTLCLTMSVAQGTEENSYAVQLMQSLERRGMLDRKLEALPNEAVIAERDMRGEGLTRPEFAVLMAYSKLALHEALITSSVPDDAYLSRELFRYFPSQMRDRFGAEIATHKLRREIISTMLANSMVNRGGAGFVSRLAEETGASVAEIAAAFALARDSFRIGELNASVDALDNKIPGQAQTRLYLDLQRLLRWSTIWFLRHESLRDGLETLVELYGRGIEDITRNLAELVPEAAQGDVIARKEELIALGIPVDVASRFAWHRHVQRAPDAVRIAAQTGADITRVARVLYASAGDLGVDRLILEGSRLAAKDFIERQAINRLLVQAFSAHRSLVARVVRDGTGKADPWEAWKADHDGLYRKVAHAIHELLAEKSFTLARLTVAQGLLTDLVVD